MRSISVLFLTASILKVIICSASNYDTVNGREIVKIIKTKCYSTKTSFDKLVLDEPRYNLYFNDLDIDLSWSVRYLDKFSNTIKLENFNIDSSGKEKIFKTQVFEYFSNQPKKLALIKTIYDWGGNEELKYIRDQSGQLLEKILYNQNKIFEKTIYTYNSQGYKIKEDIFREKGLTETREYFYECLIKDSCKIIKETSLQLELQYRTELQYMRSADGKNIKTIKKEFDNENLVSQLKIYHNKWVDQVPTETIIEGYDPPRKYTYANGAVASVKKDPPFRKTTVKILNKNKEVLSCCVTWGEIGSKGQTVTSNKVISLFGGYNNCIHSDYTYNEQKEWTDLQLTDGKQTYIVTREITYLN